MRLFFSWEVVNLKYKRLKGISLFESLIGFVLFSMILTLYMPSYQTELVRMKQFRQQAQQWRIFYDLVVLSLYEKEDDLSEYQILQHYHGFEIEQFFCTEYRCYIQFAGGVEYEVSIETFFEGHDTVGMSR